jgi:hypothetical protein
MCPDPLVGCFLNPWLSKYVNCSEYDELVIGRLEPIERAENVVPDALGRQRLRERLNAMRQRIRPQPRLHPQRGRRFFTLDHRPHLLPPSVSFSMNYRCARKPRNAAEVHETSAVQRSQARHPAWVAGRVVPAAPSNADHEPNRATKGRTRRARKKSRVLRSRHAAHGHLDDNHGASADQVSAGHVDVDCPIGHRRDDVLAGAGCAGVCA